LNPDVFLQNSFRRQFVSQVSDDNDLNQTKILNSPRYEIKAMIYPRVLPIFSTLLLDKNQPYCYNCFRNLVIYNNSGKLCFS